MKPIRLTKNDWENAGKTLDVWKDDWGFSLVAGFSGFSKVSVAKMKKFGSPSVQMAIARHKKAAKPIEISRQFQNSIQKHYLLWVYETTGEKLKRPTKGIFSQYYYWYNMDSKKGRDRLKEFFNYMLDK